MKKNGRLPAALLSGLFALIMMLAAVLGTKVYAADSDAELAISVDKTDIKEGDTIEVNVDLSKNGGLSAVRFKMLYDKDVIELTAIATEYDEDEGDNIIVSALSAPTVNPDPTVVAANKLNEEADGKVEYVWALDKNRTKTGALLTMTFKVKDAAKLGKTTISLDGLDFSKTDANDQNNVLKATVEAKNADLQVKCGHKTTTTEITKAATCTEEGVQAKKCTICGEVIETQKITALGHAYGEHKVTKAPTCTEAGEETAECSRCGETDVKSIAALGHAYGEYKVTKEPTCTEAGEETAQCSRCGTTDVKAIPALGHKYEKYEIVKDATDTENGEMSRICGVCGEAVTTAIPKVSAEDFTLSDEKGNALKASCSVDEKVVFTASVYGKTSNPLVGDMCYVPVSWKLGGVETKFEEGKYTAEFTQDKAGDYDVEIMYERRFYTSAEAGWVADGKTFKYVSKITVEEAKSAENNSEASSETKAEKDSSDLSAKGDAPTTGDSAVAVMAILAVMVLAAAGVMLISNRKYILKIFGRR